MFCIKCGSKLSDGAAFCPNCGAKIINSANTEQVSEKVPVQSVELDSVKNTEQTAGSSAISTIYNAGSAYSHLMESSRQYPKIKQVSVAKAKGANGDILKIKTALCVYEYNVNRSSVSGEVIFSWSYSWRAWLAVLPIYICDGLFL